MKIIKPALLKDGDTIGILAPSGAMEDDTNLKRAVTFFENRGSVFYCAGECNQSDFIPRL